ncbi:hypothetical protein BG842_02190 [Haladaptatus sp. W1]|uniref:HalOD1 output domain-containing protein n=1 Tax=Haladaptatus sp. W1 TaxID=1897478 RepID=UPI000849C9DF|nr:HalOD1 output domain-containing protein [Haladaptatus sp. W1]ODR80382.1 hypothetical protein BG842_02190 [Haladaptatus sp. W1]
MEYEYDSTDDVYRAYLDFESGDSFSTSIVMLITAVEGIETQDMIPLYSALNPDALDAIFQSQHRSDREDGYVWFVFAGYEVTVFADGVIELRKQKAGEPSRLLILETIILLHAALRPPSPHMSGMRRLIHSYYEHNSQ